MWDTKHISIKSEQFFHKSKVKTSIKGWNNLQTLSALKVFLAGLRKASCSHTFKNGQSTDDLGIKVNFDMFFYLYSNIVLQKNWEKIMYVFFWWF